MALASCAGDDTTPNAESHGVAIEAEGCGPVPRTSAGTVVGPGLVLTAAHPVVGADRIVVDHQGQLVEATVAEADPALDLAVLRVPDLGAPAPDRATLSTGANAAYRGGDGASVSFSVARQVDITFADIYGQGSTTRPGYELEADVEPGDSGAGLLVDGRLGGVVFAASTRAPGRGWATDIAAADALLAGDQDPTATDLACVP
ncbi:MAG: trypsin-like peptidase domain-containing protein [Acidimicrobiia bacterium]|nr:trypsin-like peptidase domain-containing protein [Acidimicrobiia bacterium]